MHFINIQDSNDDIFFININQIAFIKNNGDGGCTIHFFANRGMDTITIHTKTLYQQLSDEITKITSQS